MKVLQLQIITSSPANRHLPSSFFFWTTLELCRLPQVLFCTAWWETMEGGWKLQLASGRREKETRGKEWKGQRECDKSAPPIAPGKRRYKCKVLKASGQKVMPLLCGLFHLKSGLRKPHPPIFLLEQFPSGDIFSVWLRKSTFNLLLYARTPTPIRTLANELSKMFLIKNIYWCVFKVRKWPIFLSWRRCWKSLNERERVTNFRL